MKHFSSEKYNYLVSEMDPNVDLNPNRILIHQRIDCKFLLNLLQAEKSWDFIGIEMLSNCTPFFKATFFWQMGQVLKAREWWILKLLVVDIGKDFVHQILEISEPAAHMVSYEISNTWDPLAVWIPEIF